MELYSRLSASDFQGVQPLMSFNYGAGNYARVRRTFWLLCVFLAIPFVIHPYENFPNQHFSIWIDLPVPLLSYQSYYTQIWTGWNALSDPASTFFVMLCVLLGIFRANGIPRMILISGLFAFACLIRINNIFFAKTFVPIPNKEFINNTFSCLFCRLFSFHSQSRQNNSYRTNISSTIF